MSRIVLKRTAIAITQRCTLKCRLCNAYIPYYSNPVDMGLDGISAVLDRYFSVVDSVGVFGVLGGEPLMRKDLRRILDKIWENGDRISERLDLVTNGTLAMDADVLEFFARNPKRTNVVISHYGKLSRKADAMAETLTGLGASCRVARYHGNNLLYGGWIDYRDHSRKHFTDVAVENQSRNCVVRQGRYYLITEGQMHTCTRSHWRIRSGIVAADPEHYLDLADSGVPVAELRERLLKLEAGTATPACAFCFGAGEDAIRYPAAEQLP